MELSAAVQAKVQLGEQDEALEMLGGQETVLPLHAGLIYLWRAELHAAAGRSAASIDTLADAVDAGCRYRAEWLRGDRALAELAGREAFEAIVVRAGSRYAEDQARAEPSLSITQPQTGPPPSGYPVLVALHGNNSNVPETARYWTSACDVGWVVALPQSGEIGTSPDSYTWNDRERTGAELEAHLGTLRARGDIDPRAIVIAGFSMGGLQALALALTRRVSTCGVLTVGAYLPHVREFAPLIESGAASGLRFYLLVGAKDSSGCAGARELASALAEAGIPARLDERADLGHAYPADMKRTLREALAFLAASTTAAIR